MPICPICDDTGLQNSDSANPEFCYCAAGKQARRQWETSRTSTSTERKKTNEVRPASFIDIADLDNVNASVEAMRASLFGYASDETTLTAKHPSVQLLYQVAHAGHEISVPEATQLYELAKALEGFLGNLAPIGRNQKR